MGVRCLPRARQSNLLFDVHGKGRMAYYTKTKNPLKGTVHISLARSSIQATPASKRHMADSDAVYTRYPFIFPNLLQRLVCIPTCSLTTVF
jgi:hypothetical protein